MTHFITHFPIIIAAGCVTLYWLTVAIKLYVMSRKIGKQPNIVPKEKLGRVLRIVWFPIILLWNYLLWHAALGFPYQEKTVHFLLHYFQGPFWTVLAYITAFVACVALYLSFICWREMGKSWRVGIDPNEKTTLITTGPYRFTLHPIYSLSMLLAIATLFVVPSTMMFLVITLHVSLLAFEAIREEKHLIAQHGQAYLDYMKNVGRFIPKCRC